mgnify:CR=1 FL=1
MRYLLLPLVLAAVLATVVHSLKPFSKSIRTEQTPLYGAIKMPDQLKKDNKRVPGSNTLAQAGTFAGLTLIGLPIFVTVLLPSAILSMTANGLMNLVSPVSDLASSGNPFRVNASTGLGNF